MPFDLTFDAVSAKQILTLYMLQFVIFTVLAWFANGKAALSWSEAKVRSARVNWSFIVLNSTVAPLAVFLVGGVKGAMAWANMPVIPESFWAAYPLIIPALAALVLYDFCEYWFHRIKHVSFLWPMHAVHHSDTELQYTSWFRAHTVELIATQIAFVVVASWLGASMNMIVWVALARALHQQYVHTNIDWSHGRLNWLLASPRFHRWHHARNVAAYDKNFASVMPLWDHMFGTFYCPGPCKGQEMGFDDNPGDNFLKLLWYPFAEWGKMIARPFERNRV